MLDKITGGRILSRKWTTEYFNEFVKNNSECELLSEAISYKKKVLLRCKCGEEFETTIEKFVTRNKRQCNGCGRQKTIEGRRYTYTFVKEFIEENSNCILLSDSYVGVTEPLSLLCGCGCEFETNFDYFKNGNKRMCNNCSEIQRIENLKHSYEEVKNYIEEKGCTLISETYVDVKAPLNIECACGEVFKTSFDNFKNGKDKTRCDKCTGKQSKGEIRVEEWLQESNIPYKRQYRFSDCRLIKPLPFDFAVFDDYGNLLMLIEYDGEQHYHPYRFKDNKVFEYEKLLSLQERDRIKDEYCETNNINLLRIPYTELNNIHEILSNTLY